MAAGSSTEAACENLLLELTPVKQAPSAIGSQQNDHTGNCYCRPLEEDDANCLPVARDELEPLLHRIREKSIALDLSPVLARRAPGIPRPVERCTRTGRFLVQLLDPCVQLLDSELRLM
jgi:hypothetical protein